MNSIEKIINFIIEIEKLKSVSRKTKPIGLKRFENSAEHSWHVCISALMLKEYANENINIEKVIKMLLIHDLGEIDAGDTVVYYADKQEIKASEEDGIKRILQILPEEKAAIYLKLWYEFEAGKTPESKYAKAIDRIPPLLHNIYGNGHSWKEHNITKGMILSLNEKHIKSGSKKIWEHMESKLKKAISNGILE